MLQESVSSQGKIDLITLSETHISSAETGCEELYTLSGYVFLTQNRVHGKGWWSWFVCKGGYFIQTAI